VCQDPGRRVWLDAKISKGRLGWVPRSPRVHGGMPGDPSSELERHGLQRPSRWDVLDGCLLRSALSASARDGGQVRI
jgi:hypothetical protein